MFCKAPRESFLTLLRCVRCARLGCSNDAQALVSGGPGRSLQAALKARKAVGLQLSAAPPWAFVFQPKLLLCSRRNDRKSECDTTGPHVHTLTMCCETVALKSLLESCFSHKPDHTEGPSHEREAGCLQGAEERAIYDEKCQGL